jgi:periplasmic copper chaperone A
LCCRLSYVYSYGFAIHHKFISFTMPFTSKLIAACAVFTVATSAFAHVTLEQSSAEINTYTKATLRIGHGCEGLPTAVLRVQIPEGFQGAKPMPKQGWTLATMRAKLASPYNNHGTAVTDDVSEITWTANSRDTHLQDAHYDEFVLRGKTPATPGPLWFKVTQLCKEGDKVGRNAWVEVPAAGNATKDLQYPAALLNVTMPASADAAASVKETGGTPPVHKH